MRLICSISGEKGVDLVRDVPVVGRVMGIYWFFRYERIEESMSDFDDSSISNSKVMYHFV
jgi:hypothetical protein